MLWINFESLWIWKEWLPLITTFDLYWVSLSPLPHKLVTPGLGSWQSNTSESSTLLSCELLVRKQNHLTLDFYEALSKKAWTFLREISCKLFILGLFCDFWKVPKVFWRKSQKLKRSQKFEERMLWLRSLISPRFPGAWE